MITTGKPARAGGHELLVADALARVLTGGDTDLTVAESTVLDLERHAVLTLFRTQETRTKMASIIGEAH